MSDTPIGDQVGRELGFDGEDVGGVVHEVELKDGSGAVLEYIPDEPQPVDDPVDDGDAQTIEDDETADDDEAGDVAADDELPEGGPGEIDEAELTEDTGSLIDEYEDPGIPEDDDPFGEQYTNVGSSNA